jgi:hypothetical protein
MITAALPTHAHAHIIWLQLESLCRQVDAPEWELIVCEEDSDRFFGADGLRAYEDRLKAANCVQVQYLKLPKWVPLGRKWVIIRDHMHPDSVGMMLCASDNWSPPSRVADAQAAMDAGHDWLDTQGGWFYDIVGHRAAMYDLKKSDRTGLFMCVSTEAMRKVTRTDYPERGIDKWIRDQSGTRNPHRLPPTTFGIHTDGLNSISKYRRTIYAKNEMYTLADADHVLMVMPKELRERLRKLRPRPFMEVVPVVLEDDGTRPDTIELAYQPFAKARAHSMIGQMHVSDSVAFFRERWMSHLGMKPYADHDAPLLMMGMYGKSDLEVYAKHRGPLTVVWCGSDALILNEAKQKVLAQRNARHIAIGSFVSASLQKFSVEHEVIPVWVGDPTPAPCPRGNRIYAYGAGNKRNFYRENLWDEIEQRTGLEIVRATKDTYTRDELQTVYRDCFIGLRLTSHDGLPNTVIELGLMGRRCIYNGDLPNAIKWENVDDICESIMAEYVRKDEDDMVMVAAHCADHVDIGDDWLMARQETGLTSPVPPAEEDNRHPDHMRFPKEILHPDAVRHGASPQPFSVVGDSRPPSPDPRPCSIHTVLLHSGALARPALFGLTSALAQKGAVSIADNATGLNVKKYPFRTFDAALDKTLHGQWWQAALDLAKAQAADAYLFLPDDLGEWDLDALARLCSSVPAGAWAINPVNDGRPFIWDPQTPPRDVKFSSDMKQVTFVDKAVILSHAALALLGWKMPEVPPSWHQPGSSNGIGHYLSKKLNDRKVPIYRPVVSAVVKSEKA